MDDLFHSLTSPVAGRLAVVDILPDVKQAVRSKIASGRSTLRGSAVGAMIQQAAQAKLGYKLDIRTAGGIRGFVATYLSDVLRPAQQLDTSADYVFEAVPAISENAVPDAGKGTAQPATTRDFWRAFTNPTLKSQVSIDEGFDIVLLGNTDLPRFKHVLTPISAETQFQWARDYVASELPEQFRSDAVALLDERTPDDFSAKWVAFLKRPPMRHGSNWEKFRVERASDVLRSQLSQLGCPGEKQERLVQNLVLSQKAKPARSVLPKISTAGVASEAIPPSSPVADDLLRELARFVFDRSPNEAMREIRVPLGLVCDFINQRFGQCQ